MILTVFLNLAFNIIFAIFFTFSAFFRKNLCLLNDFIWDFGYLPFPSHLGKYIQKTWKISTEIHEIGKIKATFGYIAFTSQSTIFSGHFWIGKLLPYKAVQMAK